MPRSSDLHYQFSTAVTLSAHRQAEKFRSQQANPQKAKQVYLNALAVCAVRDYCQVVGIETDLDASDSWNPILQTLADISDLKIEEVGKVECRPVVEGDRAVKIPPEVWQNRIGYIAVQFDRALETATLLGFSPPLAVEALGISELEPLDKFLQRVEQLRSPVIPQVSRWLQGAIDAGWDSLANLEKVLSLPQPVFSFRSHNGVKRGRLLNFANGRDRVALLVGVKAETASEMRISVEVVPGERQTQLPYHLQLAILDDMGEAVMQSEACNTDKLHFMFLGEPGEQFGIRLSLDDFSMTENLSV